MRDKQTRKIKAQRGDGSQNDGRGQRTSVASSFFPVNALSVLTVILDVIWMLPRMAGERGAGTAQIVKRCLLA